MTGFLDSLNERQRQAACFNSDDGGGALVLAGAGTGKTRVLTSRIAWLTAHRQCLPSAILAVTFTNKAAREMRTRAEQMAPMAAGGLMLGTFHGVCCRMLRKHAAAAGWGRDFQILDSSDQKTLIKRLLGDLELSVDEFPPSECAYYINAAKEAGWRAADITGEGGRRSTMREIYEHYELVCRKEDKVDFAELLLSATELLQKDKHLRQHYAARFRHILIDEFQDTNPLQYKWLKLLDAGDNAFFAVGDDDQSIYAFRGADPENMRRIQRDLRAREMIRLEQNYRSTGNILTAANLLISGNKDRLGKTLFTDSGAGDPILLQRAASDLQEADHIARAAKTAIAAGAKADDIAVLYRTNAQSRLFEKAMMQYGVPYRIYGGTRFFDRLEIKHALAYLRLAAGDDTDALLRVINTPPRGIGKKTEEALAESGDMFAGLQRSGSSKVAAFRMIVQKLRAHREKDSLPELARAAVEDSGLLAYYQSRPQEMERAGNLQEFVNAATRFEPENEEEDPLLAFLANAALESGESQGEDGEAVNLMTVHAAKGLEFMQVHIAGLEEGMFPHANSLDALSPNALEEERRLMYVALTRARKKLQLHFADQRMTFGQTKVSPPSRFLTELPQKSVQVAPVAESSGGLLFGMGARGKEKDRRSHGGSHAGSRFRFKSDGNRHAHAKKHAKMPAATPELRPSPKRARRSGKSLIADCHPGDVVSHPKYGSGVIVKFDNDGEEQKVIVAFKKEGTKTYVTSLSPLKPVK